MDPEHISEGWTLSAIKTQKQVSYGVAHSQRREAPSSVLFPVVKHMATLTKSLQIAQAVLGGIMVKVRSRQHDPGGAFRLPFGAPPPAPCIRQTS